MTRLNGIPIQMLAMMTEVSDQRGEVSQLTGAIPTAWRRALTTPESLLSIHDHVEADTISGSSHGTRNNARSRVDRRKCWWKNTANAMPMLNWAAIEARVNSRVWVSAGPKVASVITCR